MYLWKKKDTKSILIMFSPWKKSHDKPKQHVKKQRHHFAHKDQYSQTYVLQEGGPLPEPETGLLSNARKWIVRGDTCADKARDFIGKGTGWRAGGWGNPGELLLRFLCLESTLLHEKPKEGPLPHMEGETWGVETAPYFFYPVLRIF